MNIKLSTFFITLFFSIATCADTEYIYSSIDSNISQPTFTKNSEPRELWGLSEEEWERYQQIITLSPWSVWEHNATPLSLLAFYSDNQAERRRYARRQAELDQWREAAVMLWEQLYDQERLEVNKEFKAALQNQTEHKSISSLSNSDQVLVFIDLDQCEQACKATSNQIFSSEATAHLYFMGRPDREKIFQWASQMEIPVERVKQKNITLNTERGEARRYGVDPDSLSEKQGVRTFFRHVTGVKEIL
jgi:integrating conjugative element protein (TIGR03759 family)